MTSWSAVCWGANVKFAAEIPTQTSPLLSMLISYVVQLCSLSRSVSGCRKR